MKKKDSFSLKNLIDIKEWQKIQDNFSNVTEINLRTFDPDGNPVTSPSKTPRLCSEILRNCWPCLPTFLGGNGVVDKNLIYFCETGVANFIAPLRLGDGRIMGYIILGPVILVMRKSRKEYDRIAEKMHLSTEAFWDAIVEIKVVSYHGMQSLVELIEDIGEYTLNLAYKNIAYETPKLNHIFDVLLDVAFEVSGADTGSVMFFDDKRENLTIRSAKGIPDDIVKNTKVKAGDGISGISAQEGTPFLINETIADKRIKPYLRRPHISSSMVLPLKIENRIMGVVNLGALKSSQVRFNDNSMNLMNRLINLATIAIR